MWVILNNFYATPAYFIYMTLLLPLRFLNSKLYWRFEEIMFSWLLAMVACWNYTAGYTVREIAISTDDDSLHFIWL